MLDITGLPGPRESHVANLQASHQPTIEPTIQATAPANTKVNARATLHQAQRARLQAELAGCEMEELAAVLHRKPPVGRWPQLTRACFGPSVAVLSG